MRNRTGCLRPPPRSTLFIVVLIAALSFDQSAQADGDEGPASIMAGLILMGSFGIPAVGLDITNIVFITRGPSPSVSRRVVGILSIVHGVGLMVAGVLTVSGPASSDPSMLDIMGTVDFTFGAATIGLGIGCLLRYKKPSVAFAPLVIADVKGVTSPGIGLGGTF